MTTQPDILLINGPNLNLLGRREPEIYGTDTLADVEARAASAAGGFGLSLKAVQSNHEGALIDAIHEMFGSSGGIIINPGAFTHTSVALRDAFSAVARPVVEVHLSNVHARESFRHHSYIAGIAAAVICGCGVRGYDYAVAEIAHLLKSR